MVAVVRENLYVRSETGHPLGSFIKWPGEQSNWSLREEIVLGVLSSRISCCSRQINGSVVCEKADLALEADFSVQLSLCESLCCGLISPSTIYEVQEAIKTAAASALSSERSQLSSEHFHIGSPPTYIPEHRIYVPAQELLQRTDIVAREHDPTPDASAFPSANTTPIFVNISALQAGGVSLTPEQAALLRVRTGRTPQSGVEYGTIPNEEHAQ